MDEESYAGCWREPPATGSRGPRAPQSLWGSGFLKLLTPQAADGIWAGGGAAAAGLGNGELRLVAGLLLVVFQEGGPFFLPSK